MNCIHINFCTGKGDLVGCDINKHLAAAREAAAVAVGGGCGAGGSTFAGVAGGYAGGLGMAAGTVGENYFVLKKKNHVSFKAVQELESSSI